eukprot:scaffold1012_cov418-Prasinococcus_capsulatus_cf.AAC.7
MVGDLVECLLLAKYVASGNTSEELFHTFCVTFCDLYGKIRVLKYVFERELVVVSKYGWYAAIHHCKTLLNWDLPCTPTLNPRGTKAKHRFAHFTDCVVDITSLSVPIGCADEHTLCFTQAID